MEHASANALPHWPAPVSVVTLSIPCSYDVNDFESKEEAIETARFDFKELIEDMANYDIDDLKTDPEYIYVVELGTDYEDRQINCPECGREIPRRINPFDKCPKCDGELELVSTMLLDGV